MPGFSHPHSKSRIESFSDGVFAFAATLIVVSFEVPEHFEELRELVDDFIGFGISFMALMFIWKIHYSFFRRITYVDNVTILLNTILLFVILFYVYPMKFISNMIIGKSGVSSFDDLSSLFVIYGSGFALVFLLFTLMYRYSSNKESQEENKMLKYWFSHFSNYVYIALISILLAYFDVGVTYGVPGFVYMLIGPISYIHGKKAKL